MSARKRGLLASVVGTLALGLGVLPGAAQAGTYNVYSCSIDGGFFGNGAWGDASSPVNDPRYVTDGSCSSPGDPLTTALANNNTFGQFTFAVLAFNAPSGTYISDWQLVLHGVWFSPGYTPPGGTAMPDETTYNGVAIGDSTAGAVIAGSGRVEQRFQDAAASDGHWFGYRGAHSSGSADTGVYTLTRGNSSHASALIGRPTTMNISAGCYPDPAGDCSMGTNSANNAGTDRLELFGARVTISDDSNPALSGPAAGTGLRAAGTRAGSEPVTFSATDNVGLRTAELVDVTDAANPKVVAAKDYNSGTLTAQDSRCNFTLPRPCPNLSNESLGANPPIAGHRTLLVRVTDAAGNETVSSPFAVYARGAANGANASDTARLTAGFPAKVYRRSKAGKRYYTYVLRPSRTVSYGKGGTLRGILRNAEGQPISGADVRILVRENRTGAQYVDRGGLTTGADGRVSLGIPAGSSRTYQLTYKAFVGDDNLAARSKATLNTRARITVRAPRHVRGRGTARFRGTLVGRPRPRRGVTLELQAFQPRRGWRTVATPRTGKSGRYSVRYKFNSRHGSFRFRMRLRPNDAYPYARGTSKRLRVRVG